MVMSEDVVCCCYSERVLLITKRINKGRSNSSASLFHSHSFSLYMNVAYIFIVLDKRYALLVFSHRTARFNPIPGVSRQESRPALCLWLGKPASHRLASLLQLRYVDFCLYETVFVGKGLEFASICDLCLK